MYFNFPKTSFLSLAELTKAKRGKGFFQKSVFMTWLWTNFVWSLTGTVRARNGISLFTNLWARGRDL